MFRSAFFLLSGNAASSLLTLARNLIIARLIPVEDYGIAATFAIAMTLVEMVSALGLEQQIVQAKRGEDPDFQAALQGFTALRGFISFALLFASAGLMASFLNVPELAWAYQLMALAPLIRGFAHFDNHRQKRKMQFGPTIRVQFGSTLIAVAAIWPAYVLFPDYRVMLISLLIQAAAFTAITHILAERPYRMKFSLEIWRGSVRFGWPLMINGVLLFAILHGEKLVAGRVLGLTELGLLAMGLTLTMTPTLILARVMHDFFLPQLSAAQDDDATFQHLAEVTMQTVLAMALVYLLGVVIIGGPLVILLLDEKYITLTALMTWLGIQQTLRVLKSGGATIALARGQTENALFANFARVASLPFAAWIAMNGGGLIGVIYAAAVGEAAAFTVSLLMITLRLKVSMRRLAPPILMSVLALGVAGTIAWRTLPEASASLPDPISALILTVVILAALVTMRRLHGYAMNGRRAVPPSGGTTL